jgi:hypothetical protein
MAKPVNKITRIPCPKPVLLLSKYSRRSEIIEKKLVSVLGENHHDCPPRPNAASSVPQLHGQLSAEAM